MRFAKIFVRFSISIAMLLVAASAPARAEEPNESYYMTIFSAQADSRDPRRTHSFASFVKAIGTGDSAKDYPIEVHTISWMPRSTMLKSALAAKPDDVWLISLMGFVRMSNKDYRSAGEFYDRAIKQEARLNSGLVLYKAIDRRFRPGMASNCIHAVSDLDTDNGLLHSGQGRGEAASRQVAQHLNRWIINPGQTHAWVASRLGLNDQSVNRPDLGQQSLLASR